VERPSQATSYFGWEATETAIARAMQEHEPIDGILSFSQGACCAAVYSVKSQLSPMLPRPKFVVFISGFLPHDASWTKEMLETGIHIPSLHVFGEKDTIITMDRSKMLQGICSEAQVLCHAGGHFVPTCNGQVRDSGFRIVA
jgi:predicted esterase